MIVIYANTMVLNLMLRKKKGGSKSDPHAVGGGGDGGPGGAEITAAPAAETSPNNKRGSSEIVETGDVGDVVTGGMTVGCFDVFHRGHNALIERLMSISDVVSIGCGVL